MTFPDPRRSTHDLVSDTSRPLTEEERKAADRDAPQAAGNAPSSATEPSFTRIPRPSANNDDPPRANRWMSGFGSGSSALMPMGIGWTMLCAAGGVGIWLWMRRRREQNKPINRLRRQAQQARQRAYQLRERIPDVEMPEDAARPAIGLGTALLSLALLYWQQSQARSRSHQAERVADGDWRRGVMQFRDQWVARYQPRAIHSSR